MKARIKSTGEIVEVEDLYNYESKPNIFSCDIHHISIIHRAFPVDILTVQCIPALLA